ncbi:hypothetical protein MKX03_015583 [Papaver bracteatum]|nr:hypothetical protein MKX03_015583 [Papaver bracteatum]
MLLLNGETLPQRKLLLLYLETIDKTVLPRMILILVLHLDFFVCLNETEIIEVLIPSILANLEHFMSIYKLPQGEQLLVDAPEMIEKALSYEQDPSAKRNAFLMLFTCAQERSISIPEWGEEIMVDMIMDVLRALTSPNLDIRRKTIDITFELISPGNIDEVVQALKRKL